MAKEFRQVAWDELLEDDCRQLVRLAVREDLDRLSDWTTLALVSETAEGRAQVVARAAGVVGGLPAIGPLVDEYDRRLQWAPHVPDGSSVAAGDALGELSGPARSLLAVERPLLNLLGHLSGIATRTRQFVNAVVGTPARIFDTRKTLPGWRRLEKLAVRAGGGWNHRLGLFDGILIKDNHLALGAKATGGEQFSPAQAVRRARQFLEELAAEGSQTELLVEIEVDSLDPLPDVLAEQPDLVLLDNMSPEQLRQAVAMRNDRAPEVQLEASGGIRLENVRAVALTGVERISIGALTHSAAWFDVGLDWVG